MAGNSLGYEGLNPGLERDHLYRLSVSETQTSSHQLEEGLLEKAYLWHVGVAGHWDMGCGHLATDVARFGMDDKRLPPSTNARRAGISNLVSGNLTPPNLTAPEQQTYAERGNNMLDFQSSLDERLTHQYPGSLDTKGLAHSVPARVYDRATADHDTLQGSPGTIRGDQLQNATSYVQPPGQADYGFGYEVPGREDTWLATTAERMNETESGLGFPTSGYCSGVGGTGNNAASNPAYAGRPGPRENPWGYDSNGYFASPTHSSDLGHTTTLGWTDESPGETTPLQQPAHSLASVAKKIPPHPFKCDAPGCGGRFWRHEHLKRHLKNHTNEKPFVCWVPDCNKSFSRNDNLRAHYVTTHGRKGGRNRYVATLDEKSSDYDPEYRGDLTPDGRPLRE
ncbi:C2H2 zinc finger domain-containing protein [Histoplasma capsulatum]|uniref:C2H2 zinc finger domain-containing protein n=1 Tax=Ajellomyces capsulatus TaxID=5037 RepID=A0A8A1MKF9_AJECA|nr:C2H2 zinc finger domain-containing protein [Histoplasma capsulatum]